MRFGYTLLVAGALSLGIGIQAQADDFISQKAGNVTISLPSGWEVLPKGVLKQFSQENGPEILLLAQGPADDFLKLSIIRNPDPGTQEAFLKQDAAQTEKNCKKLIGELESQLGTGKAEATCGKVENNGVAALATQLAIPAQDNRPELINMTWVYPNGDKGVIANAMFLKKDAGKYEADVKKALQSIKFDKSRATATPAGLWEFRRGLFASRGHTSGTLDKKRFTIRFTRTLKRFSFSGTRGRAHLHATAYILFPKNREIPILRRNELHPRRLPTSQKSLGGREERLGRGEGTFLRMVPSPLPNIIPSSPPRTPTSPAYGGTGARRGYWKCR